MSAEALARLLHVSGVLGSFTCAESGLVLAASMPEQFSPAALEGTAARVANLLATADDSLPECRSVKLAFADHQLWVRRFRTGLLCVLTAEGCDQQMLRVTTRLVLRQLSLGAPAAQ